MGEVWDPGRVSKKSKFSGVMRLLRVEHTIFSLPFAYLGVAYSSFTAPLEAYFLVALALFFLRSAGMTFNDLVDVEIDRLNPRTKSRPLVLGVLSKREACTIFVVSSLAYFFTSYLINIPTLVLSPIPYFVAISYPYAKRVHWIPHLHLGLVLGLAPIGGYVAVEGYYSSIYEIIVSAPYSVLLAVTLWVAGFDVIYSILDLEFDKKYNLGSIPSRLGVSRAILTSETMHLLSTVFYAYSIYSLLNNLTITLLATILVASLYTYQYTLVSKSLEGISKAFNVNLVQGPIMALTPIAFKVLLQPRILVALQEVVFSLFHF